MSASISPSKFSTSFSKLNLLISPKSLASSIANSRTSPRCGADATDSSTESVHFDGEMLPLDEAAVNEDLTTILSKLSEQDIRQLLQDSFAAASDLSAAYGRRHEPVFENSNDDSLRQAILETDSDNGINNSSEQAAQPSFVLPASLVEQIIRLVTTVDDTNLESLIIRELSGQTTETAADNTPSATKLSQLLLLENAILKRSIWSHKLHIEIIKADELDLAKREFRAQQDKLQMLADSLTMAENTVQVLFKDKQDLQAQLQQQIENRLQFERYQQELRERLLLARSNAQYTRAELRKIVDDRLQMFKLQVEALRDEVQLEFSEEQKQLIAQASSGFESVLAQHKTQLTSQQQQHADILASIEQNWKKLLSEKDTEHAILRKQIAELEASLQEQANATKQQQYRVEDKDRQVVSLKEQIEQLNTQLVQVQQAGKQQLKDLNAKARAAIEQRDAHLNEQHNVHSSLRADIARLQQQLQDSDNHVNNLRHKCQEYQQQCDRYESQLNERKQKLVEQEVAARKLQQQLHSLEKQLYTSEQELNDMHTTMRLLNEDLDAAQLALEDQQEDLLVAHTQLDDQEKLIQAERETAEFHRAELQQFRERAHKELRTAKKKVDSLQQELEQTQSALTQAQQVIESEQQRRSLCMEAGMQTEEDITAHEKRAQQLQHLYEEVLAKYTKLKNAVVTEQQSKSDKQVQDMQSLQQTNDRLVLVIEQLREDLEQVKNSSFMQDDSQFNISDDNISLSDLQSPAKEANTSPKQNTEQSKALLNQFKARVQQLEQEKQNMMQTIQELNREQELVELSKTKVQELSEQVQFLKARNRRLSMSADQRVPVSPDLQAQLSEVYKERDTLLTHVRRLKQLVEAKYTNEQSMMDLLEQLRAKYEEATAVANRLASVDMKSLEQEKKELLEQAEAEKSVLRAHVTSLSREVATLKCLLEERANDVRNSQADKEDIAQRIVEMREKKEQYKQRAMKFKILVTEAQQKQQEAEQTAARARDEKQSIERRLRDLEQSTAEISENHARFTFLTSENAWLKQQLADLKEELAHLHDVEHKYFQLLSSPIPVPRQPIQVQHTTEPSAIESVEQEIAKLEREHGDLVARVGQLKSLQDDSCATSTDTSLSQHSPISYSALASARDRTLTSSGVTCSTGIGSPQIQDMRILEDEDINTSLVLSPPPSTIGSLSPVVELSFATDSEVSDREREAVLSFISQSDVNVRANATTSTAPKRSSPKGKSAKTAATKTTKTQTKSKVPAIVSPILKSGSTKGTKTTSILAGNSISSKKFVVGKSPKADEHK